MSHITEPRVAESSVTTGVGAFTLAGALTAHVAFSGVCAVGDTVWYDIEAIGADGLPSGAWEEGLGTYSAANTLTRTTVYRSTNANAAVNFAAGAKYVRLIADARQIAKLQNLSGVNTGDQDLSGYATTASLSAHTSSTANPHSVTAAQVGAPSGSGTSSGTNTGDETATSVGALISGATVKATPVDADALGLSDSAAANVLKKLTWANLKATLKTYFDTLYEAAITTLPVSKGGTGTGTLTGLVKGTGTTAFAAAVAGTDYQAPIGTISGIAKGNGANALTVAVAGTDYISPTGTETVSNKTVEAGTFTNGYTEETATANTGAAYTIDLVNGSLQILTLTGNCTFTFPAATAGKSFAVLLKQDATGSRTVTWPAAVKWPSGTAPTITATASKGDKLVFTADGTYWWGSVAGQAYL